MELKCLFLPVRPAPEYVSIVPLWNWNCGMPKTCIIHLFKFQSYLYGIEIPDWPICSRIYVVSIVPLWNWNIKPQSWSSDSKCFNRTFMELKYWGAIIEILPGLCFNRTFMELKFSPIRSQHCSLLFQSYLYGIEIIIVFECYSPPMKFQSYLYGIEITLTQELQDLIQSFNRTFMELKFL